MKTYQLNQMALFASVTKELSRQCPGIPADGRSNTVLKAVNMIVEEYARQPVLVQPSMGLSAWLASDEVGVSSEYMAWVLSSQDAEIWGDRRKPENSHPRDPDDFGRCLGLIVAMPSYEFLIDEMRTNHGPYWEAVAANWYPWCQFHKDERFSELGQAMRLAYSKVEQK